MQGMGGLTDPGNLTRRNAFVIIKLNLHIQSKKHDEAMTVSPGQPLSCKTERDANRLDLNSGINLNNIRPEFLRE